MIKKNKSTVLKIILIVGFLITVLSISTIYFNSETLFSEDLVNIISTDVESDLVNLFDPITEKLTTIKKELSKRDKEIFTENKLNRYFLPVLKSLPNISGVIFAERNNFIYLLYKEKSTWVSTFNIQTQDSKIINWHRWKKQDKLLSEWQQNFDDINFRNWFEDIKHYRFTNGIGWSGIHKLISTKKSGLTGITFWNAESETNFSACAFEMPLINLSKSFKTFKQFSTKKILLVNSADSLIRTIENSNDSLLVTKELPLSNFTKTITDSIQIKAVNTWNKLGLNKKATFTFQYDNTAWWCSFQPITGSRESSFIGIIVPDNELINSVIGSSGKKWALALGILLIFISVYLIWKPKLQSNNNEATAGSDLDIHTLIMEGENSSIEFKSSLRWDYREGRVNKKLEEVIMKSIAAFNNGNGGFLLIGLDDDKNILGLKNDFESLKKHNKDYLELHLRNLIHSEFGIEFAAKNIEIKFSELEEKIICLVKIKKGSTPLFLNTADKNGKKIEKFFIRSGNSSQEITSLREINNYINSRFNSD